MSTVQNTVDLIFKVTDQATANTRAIESSMESVSRSGRAAQLAISAVGTAFAGFGVIETTRKLVELSKDYEETNLRIAGSLKAMGLETTFIETQRVATIMMEAIERKAAALPGEAEDYVRVFSQNIPQVIASGITKLQDIADFTSDYAAFTASKAIDSATAALDLTRILSGQAGMDVTTFSRELRNLVDQQYATAEAFNKLSAQQRLKVISDALKKNAEGQAAAANMYSSKIGEVISKLKKMVIVASTPLFEQLKTGLAGLSAYLDENKQSVADLVNLFGVGMKMAIAVIVPPMKWLVEHVQMLAKGAALFVGAWTGAKLLGGLQAVFKTLQAIVYVQRNIGIWTAITAVLVDALKKGWAGIGEAALKTAAIGATMIASYKALTGVFDEMEKKSKGIALPEFAPVMEMPSAMAPIPMLEWSKLLKATKEPKDRKGPPKADVVIENARFDIKQNFAEGYDPDRIAAAFVDQLGAATMYRTQSSLSGQPGTGV
jgi:hypothetical protein